MGVVVLACALRFSESNKTYDTYIYDTNYGKVDFIHLAATMNGILKGGTSFRSLILGRSHVANLSGWAGDLQSLVTQTIELTNNSNNYTVFKSKFAEILGNENYNFGMADVLSDVDAYNLINDWFAGYWGGLDFGTAMQYYYNGWQISNVNNWYDGYDIRFTSFLSGQTKEEFKITVGIYCNNFTDILPAIQWPLYGNYTVTTNQANAARDVFADFIWNFAQLE